MEKLFYCRKSRSWTGSNRNVWNKQTLNFWWARCTCWTVSICLRPERLGAPLRVASSSSLVCTDVRASHFSWKLRERRRSACSSLREGKNRTCLQRRLLSKHGQVRSVLARMMITAHVGALRAEPSHLFLSNMWVMLSAHRLLSMWSLSASPLSGLT